MIYEWECKTCGYRVDVQRSIAHRSLPPSAEEGWHSDDSEIPGKVHNVLWRRVYNSSTPFKNLADRGVFMDDHGNYPPRKV